MSRPIKPVTITPGSIAVATDGSEHAERAVAWAAEQASLERRRLVVVSAGDNAQRLVEDAAAAAQQLHPDLSVRGAAVAGDPRQVLIDLSGQGHLLVVGSRGRGPVRSMLLGSISAAISAQAACPVVVCRPTTAEYSHHGVIVGADATPESRPVIEFAYRQAALRELPLTVMHCFWDATAALAQYRQSRGQPALEPELEDLRAVLAESVAGLAEEYPDVPVTLTLKHGLVDEALSPRQHRWDMIVVGRHPMTSLTRVLTGSMATAVVERAHSTVAVVPEAPSHGPR